MSRMMRVHAMSDIPPPTLGMIAWDLVKAFICWALIAMISSLYCSPPERCCYDLFCLLHLETESTANLLHVRQKKDAIVTRVACLRP
eukprot:scaffold201_cov99-Skeletonema_dohrnii-CCMP3373.AAC.4